MKDYYLQPHCLYLILKIYSCWIEIRLMPFWYDLKSFLAKLFFQLVLYCIVHSLSFDLSIFFCNIFLAYVRPETSGHLINLLYRFDGFLLPSLSIGQPTWAKLNILKNLFCWFSTKDSILTLMHFWCSMSKWMRFRNHFEKFLHISCLNWSIVLVFHLKLFGSRKILYVYRCTICCSSLFIFISQVLGKYCIVCSFLFLLPWHPHSLL